MVELKGLHTVKSKGKTYYYAWRGGPRIEAEFGTPAFHAAFQDAVNPLADLDRRRFEAWVTLFKASDEFREMAATTKRVWGPWFDEIKTEFGTLRTRQFDRPQIRAAIKKWRNRWRATPRAADMGKQVLSRILSFAVDEGAITLNPCTGISNLYQANRSDIIWEADDLELLFKHASKEVADAAKLAAATGLRQSDLLRLTWSNVKANAIERKTGKSGNRRTATIPVTAQIRAVLDGIPRRAAVILTTTAGRPWKSFGTSWNDTMHKAGLNERDLHFHDLRGTAATNYYRAGLTIREIAVILAWSEDKVERLIDRYVKKDEIILDRIKRIEAADSGFTAQRKA